MDKSPITDLLEALKDQDYLITWEANIAMAFVDAAHYYKVNNNKQGKYLNRCDLSAIGNDAAKRFISRLGVESDDTIC